MEEIVLDQYIIMSTECGNCKQENSRYKCGGCLETMYCSEKCQRLHAGAHSCSHKALTDAAPIGASPEELQAHRLEVENASRQVTEYKALLKQAKKRLEDASSALDTLLKKSGDIRLRFVSPLLRLPQFFLVMPSSSKISDMLAHIKEHAFVVGVDGWVEHEVYFGQTLLNERPDWSLSTHNVEDGSTLRIMNPYIPKWTVNVYIDAIGTKTTSAKSNMSALDLYATFRELGVDFTDKVLIKGINVITPNAKTLKELGFYDGIALNLVPERITTQWTRT